MLDTSLAETLFYNNEIENLFKHSNNLYCITNFLTQALESDQQTFDFDKSRAGKFQKYSAILQSELSESLSLRRANQLEDVFIKRSIAGTTQNPEARQILTFPHFLSHYSEHLAFFLGNMDPQLLSTQQAKFIHEVARKMPAVYMNSLTLIEFRLDEVDTVDIEILIPQNRPFSLPPEESDEAWDLIQKLNHSCEAINQHEEIVSCRWLEFDINGSSHDAAPSIFVEFHPKLSRTPAYFLQLIEHRICLPIVNDTLKVMKTCLACLPPEASVLFIGYMLRRASNQHKIIIVNFPIDMLLPYLTQIGWLEKQAELADFLAKISDAPYKFSLALDINSHGVQKVAIEMYLATADVKGFNRVFEVLTQMGICNQNKAKALIDSQFLFCGPHLSFYLGYLLHLKLVVEPHTISAKAYMNYFTSSLFLKDSEDK